MLGHRTLTAEDYVGILKRRAWIVAVPAILFAVLAFGATFFITPQYTSQTLVLIDQQKVPDNYVKPVIASDLDSRLASMREQMLSRSRIQPIIERYNLGGSRMSMDDRIEMVRKNVAIKPIHSELAHGLPGFFIAFTANDAHTAQLVCGEITSLFTSENLKSREAAALGTTEFLKGQLADAKKNLDDQDAKLAAFQRENVGKLPGEEGTSVNMLGSLNTQLEAATQALSRMEQDKSYLEAIMNQQAQVADALKTSSNATTLSPRGVPQTPQQAELQSLLAQEADLLNHYTADYPDVVAVKRKIADLRKEIAKDKADAAAPTASGAPAKQPESLGAIQLRAQMKSLDLGIQAKRAEQAQIQNNVHLYQDRIQSSPLVEEQYKELTRDYKTAEGFYNDLLGKMNSSKMATDLEARMQGEQFRVMDEPNLPDSPTYPKRPLFAFGGLFFGMALGLAISGLLEYRNTALRTERDVWAFTQLPTLAVIAYAADMEVIGSKGIPWLSRLRPKWRNPFKRKGPPVAAAAQG